MTVRIVAEAGINHNGSLDTALQMIQVAKECGADTIKFQHIDPNHFKPDLVWQGYNMRELFRQVRFDHGQWRQIMSRCEQEDIGFLCTPQTVRDFEDLLALGIREVKISSDNQWNEEIVARVVATGMPFIASTGMWDGDDDEIALPIGYPVTYLACTSEYPCPPASANLNRMIDMDRPFGFSDHTIGNTAAIMAVAFGATVIEKHFTLHHTQYGPDHEWSANPAELTSYVKAIREAELMLGSGEFKPTEKELELKKLLEA